jgi:hypothetical protein
LFVPFFRDTSSDAIEKKGFQCCRIKASP